jgi:hypothetical protein
MYCHNFVSERKNKNSILLFNRNETFNSNAAYYPHFEQQRPAPHVGGHRPSSTGGETVLGLSVVPPPEQ